MSLSKTPASWGIRQRTSTMLVPLFENQAKLLFDFDLNNYIQLSPYWMASVNLVSWLLKDQKKNKKYNAYSNTINFLGSKLSRWCASWFHYQNDRGLHWRHIDRKIRAKLISSSHWAFGCSAVVSSKRIKLSTVVCVFRVVQVYCVEQRSESSCLTACLVVIDLRKLENIGNQIFADIITSQNTIIFLWSKMWGWSFKTNKSCLLFRVIKGNRRVFWSKFVWKNYCIKSLSNDRSWHKKKKKKEKHLVVKLLGFGK